MATMRKVVIADDDRVTAETLAAALRAKRVKVTIAQDAMQAVMFAVREVPDALVLDIGMPGGTGLTSLKKLRENRKTTLLPVLVLTGLADPALPAKVAELGAGFVRKPLRPADLYPMLAEMVERRARLLELVFEHVKGSMIDELIRALAEHALDVTEVELTLVLGHLAGQGRVLEKDGKWFVA